MNVAIFSEVPLWTSHHAEAIEIALNKLSKSAFVHFISCKGALKGCPANPFMKSHLCIACKSQTNFTNKLLSKKANIITSSIILDGKIQLDFTVNSIDSLKEFKYKEAPLGNMVYSTIVTELNDSFFDFNEQKERVDELLCNAIQIYEYTYSYIKKNNIDEIYVWNGRRSCDGPSIYAAKCLNINYHPFISGGGYNKILVRDNVATVHDVPSAIKEIEKISEGLDDSKKRNALVKKANAFFNVANGQEENKGENKDINHLGYYQFSRNYKTDKNFFLRLKDKKIIAAFTGTYSEFAGVPGYDTSNDFCKTFYDGVEFLHEPSVIPDDSVLVVRWHPNSRHVMGRERERLEKIINDAPYNVIHFAPESDFSSYSLIDNCDKVIGFGSSISIESCLRGKPVLFVGRNMFQNLKCFEVAESFDDIKVFISSDSHELGEYDQALAWGAYFSSFGSHSFEFLEQILPKEFFYNGKSIRSPLLRFLRILKRFFWATKQ